MTDVTVGDDTYKEVIATDLPCTQCGYNLRGLMPDSRCPECNAAIARSLHGRMLRFANPQWLRRVRLGTALLLWRTFLWAGIGLFAFTMTGFALTSTLTHLVLLVSAGLLLAAALVATTAEPCAIRIGTEALNAKALRAFAILYFAGSILTLPAATTAVMATAMEGAFRIVGAITHFCFFRVLRGLARRFPDDRLGAHVTNAMWGFLICNVLWAMFDFTINTAIGGTAVFPTYQKDDGVSWLLVSSIALGLGYLVYGLWYPVIVLQVHHGLGVAVREAQATLGAGAGNRPPERTEDRNASPE